MLGSDTKVTITIDFDYKDLRRVPDARLAMLWHLAQANPAPHGDEQAGQIVSKIGHEIVRRWLAATQPEMYHHQERDYYWKNLGRFASHRDGDWRPDPDKLAKYDAEQANPEHDGCPRNVIDGDVGPHSYKKGALADSAIACRYCGQRKPAASDDEYLYCGADLGRSEYPFTCERRVAHDGRCAPKRDSGGEG